MHYKSTRRGLNTHYPSESELHVKPCDACGGTLEIKFCGTSEGILCLEFISLNNLNVDHVTNYRNPEIRLRNNVKKLREGEEKLRLFIANQAAELETLKNEKSGILKVHRFEKTALFDQMKKQQEDNETLKADIEILQHDNSKVCEFLHHTALFSSSNQLFIYTLCQIRQRDDASKLELSKLQAKVHMLQENEQMLKDNLKTTIIKVTLITVF